MRKRSRIPAKKSRKMFTRTAKKTNRRNSSSSRPMRGGIRL
jgi:hypothetical protein